MITVLLVVTLTGNQRNVFPDLLYGSNFYGILGSSDTHARLWNVDSGRVEREYNGHTKAVTSLAFIDS